jgi:sugar phosphate isomerase/epimerase
VRPAIKVGLSTASVYPLRTEAAFEYAARLGYDGVELMVWAETVSQDVDAIEEMAKRYDVPVLSVHAPCLLISQRVWGANPIPKLERSVRAAEQLGAQTVVVHPPLRRGVLCSGRRARGVQRCDGGGREHVSVPRRPVLRCRPDLDRADA